MSLAVRTGPVISVSKRFTASYNRGTVLQMMAEGAVHDFVRAYRSDPKTLARRYQRVAGLTDNVFEFEISGGNRMLGLWRPPRLTLLDVGGHELTGRFGDRDVRLATTAVTDAPPHFYPETPSGFFLDAPESAWADFANERSSDWIYYLDDDQAGIAESIFDSSLDVLLDDSYYQVHLVIGGPGTGKTCILLNLMKRFDNEQSFSIRLVIPESVAQYVTAATGIDLARFRGPSGPLEGADIVLVDDPDTDRAIAAAADAGKNGSAKLVVLAADPLQLEESLSDEAFDSLVEEHEINVHELHTCYRQKANIGKQTKKVAEAIAESTPFLDVTKKQTHWQQHARLTALSNDLVFRNPLGYCRVYREAHLGDLNRELFRLRDHPAGRWRHWPPLLVAVIDRGLRGLPPEWGSRLDQSGIQYALLESDRLQWAKGVEYQHVFLVMYAELFTQLDSGFEGSGRKVYEYRRLLRIPFSRAKDSLVLFSLPTTP